jgi:DNA-binding protein HU-beta
MATKKKKDVISALEAETLLSKEEAEQAVNTIMKIIENYLFDGYDVELKGLGKFYLYEHANRYVQNPMTGEAMILQRPPSIKFKCSYSLAEKAKVIGIKKKP